MDVIFHMENRLIRVSKGENELTAGARSRRKRVPDSTTNAEPGNAHTINAVGMRNDLY